MYKIWAVLLLCNISQGWSQDTTYFRSPVDRTIKMSGSFGELRNNHFHAGIDIKSSKGVVGDLIYAAADGYISRVKVQAGGYGQALYINHDNGYTTVYAHLEEFSPEVARLVRKKQHEMESFEVDIYPDHTNYQVRKGSVIGKMGNTGRSYGPHLHFEIRETASEVPENPYLHGIGPSDSRNPLLQRINVVSLDNNYQEVGSKVYHITKTKKGHILKANPIAYSDRVGIQVNTYDRMDGASNLNGTYRLEMYVDDQLHYQATLDRVPFHKMKYINSHTDFARHTLDKAWYIRCHRMPGNTLDIYKDALGDGLIYLPKGEMKMIRIVAYDFFNNTSTVEFTLRRGEDKTQNASYNKLIPQGTAQRFSLQSTTFEVPKYALDRPLFLEYTEEVVDGVPHLGIGSRDVPLFRPITLSIDMSKMGVSYENPILLNTKGKSFVNYGGEKDGDIFTVKIDALGDYVLTEDRVKPSIKVISRKKKGKKWLYTFKIKDNYSTRLGGAKLHYEARVDGEWILGNYRSMNNIYKVEIDKNKYLNKELSILVRDHSGNYSVHNEVIK